MNSEVAWVLVSSGSQAQQQIIFDPDYLPDYLFVSYDYYLSKIKIANYTNFIIVCIKFTKICVYKF